MAQSATQTTTAQNVTLKAKLTATASALEDVTQNEISSLSDNELVELRQAIKEVEDVAEDVRKGMADSEAKDRIEPGESLLGLNHVESHRKVVSEDVSTVIMKAVSDGIDYTEFVDVNASTLADVAPDIANIERQEYTYLR